MMRLMQSWCRRRNPAVQFQLSTLGLPQAIRTDGATEWKYVFQPSPHSKNKFNPGRSQFYVQEQGVKRPYVTSSEWGRVEPITWWNFLHPVRDMRALPPHFNKIANGAGGVRGWTYGAMLRRALVIRNELVLAC